MTSPIRTRAWRRDISLTRAASARRGARAGAAVALSVLAGRDLRQRRRLARRSRRVVGGGAIVRGFLEPLVRAPRDRSGERIGPWKLLRELGHGGMCTVYLAERADDLYTKHIALKLLRFDVDNLRARFITEQRVLATLDHPNIAQLLDAGADAGGVLIRRDGVRGLGQPITRWCDEHGLDVRAPPRRAQPA